MEEVKKRGERKHPKDLIRRKMVYFLIGFIFGIIEQHQVEKHLDELFERDRNGR